MNNKKTFRKYAVSTMAAATAAAGVVPAAVSADTEVDFPDVSKDNVHRDAILKLAGEGVIQGFEDGTFRPYEEVTRSQVAVMLYELLDLEAPADLDGALEKYNDVDADHRYAKQIAAVSEAEVFKGNLQGNFNPYDSITRQQMATVLVEGLGLEDYDDGEEVEINTENVSASHVHNVQILANLGITIATDDYRGYEEVTRQQFASFLNESIEVIDAEKNKAPEIDSVSAIASNKVEVTLSGNVGDLTAKDFNIKGDGLSVVKVDQKGKTATIELNKDMTDGAEYTLQLVNEEMDVLSEGTFKYELGEVASIALTKASFEEGEKVTDFLKVLDSNGVEISAADYNIVEVQSSNTDVVDNNKAGTVKAEGTANVRFKVEYKDGSVEWSDFITVNVEQAVTAELAGYHLDASDTDAYPNTVAYLNQEDENGKPKASKTVLYEGDSGDQYLQVYADDSKGNPETKALDLSTESDYEVKTLDSDVATLSQDENGVKLNYVSPGEARILITGKDNYKKTVTVNVSKDPYYKDLSLGATELNLSDEILNSFDEVTGAEKGVTEESVNLYWKDQNDVNHLFNLANSEVNDENDEIVLEDAIKQGDKLIVSTANTNGAFDISVENGKLKVEANEGKETKNASIRVSYYADNTDTKPTTQKKIATSVSDIDASKSAADYQTSVNNSALDPNTVNSATVTAYALDESGNRVGNVTDEITLTANESVSKSEENWFEFSKNTISVANENAYYMTESGAIKVNYTVAGDSDPHGTVTVSYGNSFAAPDKAAVNTKPSVIEVTDATKFTDNKAKVEDLLFGKIVGGSSDLVIDEDSDIYNAGEGNSSIAVKDGKTGYVNDPILTFLDENGNTIDSGAELYGLKIDTSKSGKGYVVNKDSGNYHDGAQFDYEYKISNDKNLVEEDGTLSIEDGKDQASFTIVLTKVTTKGDPRVNNAGASSKKNLLDSPKSIDVILK